MTTRFFFVFCCFLNQVEAALAEWTILLVMQGDNNLSYFMHNNIALLKKIGSTNNITILTQWDEPLKHTTYRYKIGKNKLLDNASLSQDMGINPELELVDAARWAFTKYPSKQRALVMWNHGSGAIDEIQGWQKHRGILYDFSSKKCLTNEGLLRSLATIQRDVLGGNKLDLIGMDACLMAMIEIAYQIKSFTNILVASENIEHTPGWHYDAIFRELTTSSQQHTASTLAHLIVRSFASFNEKRNAIYTQSAINLTNITLLKENVAAFAHACLTAPQQNILQKYISEARNTCTSFDYDRFIDLYDFYQLMQKTICSKKNLSTTTSTSLLNIIDEGKVLFKKCIIGSRTGHAFPRAHGMSIYFPLAPDLHPSYDSTLFAQETSWPLFLQKFSSTTKISLSTENLS